MLSTPQSVTINSVATDLHRTVDELTASTYENSDGTLTLRVSHQKNKSRVRRMARLDKQIIAADPLTAISQYQTAGVYIVMDEPEFGFSPSDIENLINGLKTWLTSANILAMLANRH